MEERSTLIFIVNPMSGTTTKTNWIALATKLLAKDFDLEFKFTTYAGHAKVLAQQAVDAQVPIVVAVGGDGTVNEIASTLRHTDTALAIMPLGSGNGLARDMGISPLLPFGALEVIRRGKVEKIDYGMVDDRPFFCTCGVGFDAMVSQLFAGNKKRGFVKYVSIALREYFKNETVHCTLSYDDLTVEKKAFIINFANIRQFGYSAFIAPLADRHDGLMNVTIIPPFGWLRAFILATQLFTKRLNKSRHAETFACKQLTLTMPEKTPFHCDGDPVTTGSKVTIRIVQQGLKVIVP